MKYLVPACQDWPKAFEFLIHFFLFIHMPRGFPGQAFQQMQLLVKSLIFGKMCKQVIGARQLVRQQNRDLRSSGACQKKISSKLEKVDVYNLDCLLFFL